jgi:hypothetical protein
MLAEGLCCIALLVQSQVGQNKMQYESLSTSDECFVFVELSSEVTTWMWRGNKAAWRQWQIGM